MGELNAIYRAECANCKALRARVEELEGQHKGLVIQNAILRSRPDLPADRTPAANRVAELEADRDRWKAIAEDCHSTMNLIRHRGYGTGHTASASDLEALMRRVESARAAVVVDDAKAKGGGA